MIHRFRVYPSPTSRLHFLVLVYPTRRAYQQAHRRSSGWPSAYDSAGCCHTYRMARHRPTRRVRLLPRCGEIHFIRNWLTMEIATHEATHAALGFLRRKYGHRFFAALNEPHTGLLMPREGAEERVCYAVGRIANQISVWKSRQDARDGWRYR